MKPIFLCLALSSFSVACTAQIESSSSPEKVSFYIYKSFDLREYNVNLMSLELVVDSNEKTIEYQFTDPTGINSFMYSFELGVDGELTRGNYKTNEGTFDIEVLATKTFLIENHDYVVYVFAYNVATFDGENIVVFSPEHGVLFKIHNSWKYFWRLKTSKEGLEHLLNIVGQDQELLGQYGEPEELPAPPIIDNKN